MTPEVKRTLRELRGAVSGRRIVTFRSTQSDGERFAATPGRTLADFLAAERLGAGA